MKTIQEVLMTRDGLTKQEAISRVNHARQEAQQYIEAGDLEGIEDLLAYEFGLELDYIFDLL